MFQLARGYRHRVLGILALATFLTGVLAAVASGDDGKTSPNPIQEENRKPGSLDWQLTGVKIDRLEKASGFRSSLIEGYCSHQSVQAGDTLQMMVSTTPPARFKIEVFRTGYYARSRSEFAPPTASFAAGAAVTWSHVFSAGLHAVLGK